MSNLVKLRLHGDLAKHILPEWEFSVNSVREALRFLDSATKRGFSNYFIQQDKLYSKYRILINGQDFSCPVNEINDRNIEVFNKSELVMHKTNLKTIDIVPFIESSDSKILGIITLIVGVVLLATGVGSSAGATLLGFSNTAVAFAGLTLMAAGAFALLSRPPEFGKFKDPNKAGNQSYLFDGPINIVGEGGPVPIGYGRLLVGSQVISSAYQITNYQTFRE